MSGPGKFQYTEDPEKALAFYEMALDGMADDETSSEGWGWAAAFLDEGVLIRESAENGFVYMTEFGTSSEAQEALNGLRKEWGEDDDDNDD